MLTSNLACGPMSEEIIEAVFKYSQIFQKPLMLICSRNQIDSDTGYVFTTQEYMSYIGKMASKYGQARVMICRDHCGPSFGAEVETDLRGTMRTIKCDLENGFDLIHIDLCKAVGMSHQEKLNNTVRLMKYALSIRSDVMFEIGTDENVGVAETDIERISQDIKVCQRIANPTFYVVQTGSLVQETKNTGSFERDSVAKMKEVLNRLGTRLKEHNADYLTTKQLGLRVGAVDAVNIAPQLGAIQTSCVMSNALAYGINTDFFVNSVLRGNKWRKWTSDRNNHLLCVATAGHYHFSEMKYSRLAGKLAEKCDINGIIIRSIMDVINHYSKSLKGV